jgi:hypothetical protein
MVFSGMLRRVGLVKRATRRNIPEDAILLTTGVAQLTDYG